MFYRQHEINFLPEEILDYLRKSQSDDPLLTVEEVLAKHEAILDEWAEKHLGAKVPEENKYREVVSGETIKDRPEINKILRRMESPKIKAVKVVEPQRLSRGDLEDIGRMMKLLKHTNTMVITPERIYDLRDPYDWDAFERELKRGNEYLEYYKKIQARGRLLSVSQGNYLGSIPPYGYDKTKVMDGKRECPTLKQNPEQADAVRIMFDLFVNKNYSRYKIADYLESMNIKPSRAKHWTSETVKEVLTNIHVIGKVRWNWRKWVVVVEDGEFVKTRPFSKIGEYLIYEGKHDAIIDEELFYAAQEKIGKGNRTKRGAEVRNPFVGMMFCKKCGRAMLYKHAKSKDGIEMSPPRIVCSAQKRCDSGSCNFSVVLDRVCDILEECIEDFEIRLTTDAGNSEKLHARLVVQLEKKLEDLQAKELSQWEAQTDPDPAKRMPQEIFQKLNEKLIIEKEEVRQALCKAREAIPEPVDYSEKIKTFREALEALRDPNVDAKMQNNLLKACIERIEYYRARPEKKGNVWSSWSKAPVELDVKLRV